MMNDDNDLMAERLARLAEEREDPGSSPTQDKLFNHVHVTRSINSSNGNWSPKCFITNYKIHSKIA